jgi:plastocyanin
MQHNSTFRRAVASAALALTALLGTSAAASAGMSTKPKHVKSVATARAAVKIDNFKFGPRTLTVATGTKVTWTNDDVVAHSVNFSSGKINSKTLDQHAKFSHTFSTPGTYKYICAIHPFMHGTIVVTA